ncbi:hypothetical protein DFH28DRAFT_1134714 [Melampsora americana]|nr:hypothetical protein DFH28DRAFT_1134714 [Melampsora americana]
MAPQTRRNIPLATLKSASNSTNQHGRQEQSAARVTTRSNASAGGTDSNEAPPRPTIPAKRGRKRPVDNRNDRPTNTLDTGANEPAEPQESQLNSETTPTLDNYKSLLKFWPPGRIREYLQQHKYSTHNRPSTEVRDRVKLIFKQFNQELLMLAMIDQVSEPTIKSIIPGMTSTRSTSAFTLFLGYCIKALIEPMPLRGQEESGEVLGDRNTKNGQTWRALSKDERAIFDPTIFYALSGVPNPLLDLETNGDNDEEEHDIAGDSFVPIPTVHKLTVEEDKLYRPLYEQLVDLKKVENELGKPLTGPSTSKLQRKSKTAIERIAHQLSCEAHRFDFAYYLVATSTVTPNKSSELGWIKQYTTHPQVATWANKTCRLATVFATYSQGESMAKAIASVTHKPKRQRSGKRQPSDTLKVGLGRLLAALTRKTLGYVPPQSFPQTADPMAELKRRSLPIAVVLTEGSRLTDEKLKVGFKKMRTAIRLEWFNDVKDGHFCLVKLRVGSDEPIGEPVALDSTEIETALDTTPRAIDMVVDSNITGDQPNINQASKNVKKKKHGGESDSSENSENSDSDDEED